MDDVDLKNEGKLPLGTRIYAKYDGNGQYYWGWVFEVKKIGSKVKYHVYFEDDDTCWVKATFLFTEWQILNQLKQSSLVTVEPPKPLALLSMLNFKSQNKQNKNQRASRTQSSSLVKANAGIIDNSNNSTSISAVVQSQEPNSAKSPKIEIKTEKIQSKTTSTPLKRKARDSGKQDKSLVEGLQSVVADFDQIASEINHNKRIKRNSAGQNERDPLLTSSNQFAEMSTDQTVIHEHFMTALKRNKEYPPISPHHLYRYRCGSCPLCLAPDCGKCKECRFNSRSHLKSAATTSQESFPRSVCLRNICVKLPLCYRKQNVTNVLFPNFSGKWYIMFEPVTEENSIFLPKDTQQASFFVFVNERGRSFQGGINQLLLTFPDGAFDKDKEESHNRIRNFLEQIGE